MAKPTHTQQFAISPSTDRETHKERRLGRKYRRRIQIDDIHAQRRDEQYTKEVWDD